MFIFLFHKLDFPEHYKDATEECFSGVCCQQLRDYSPTLKDSTSLHVKEMKLDFSAVYSPSLIVS